jgi:hypothetical protein
MDQAVPAVFFDCRSTGSIAGDIITRDSGGHHLRSALREHRVYHTPPFRPSHRETFSLNTLRAAPLGVASIPFCPQRKIYKKFCLGVFIVPS